MKHLLSLALITASTAATSAYAGEPNFTFLSCHKVISADVDVTIKKGKLTFSWETEGYTAFPILKQLADPKIPSSLLKQYDEVIVEYSLPVEACDFASKPGYFSCRSENERMDLTVKARIDDFEEETPYDVYKAELSSAVVKSVFKGKKDRRYLEFPMTLGIKGKKEINLVTPFFFAHYWESEGISQPPSCHLDNKVLVD